jgi:alpha-tubulin suppressor-like RCC1 family protein
MTTPIRLAAAGVLAGAVLLGASCSKAPEPVGLDLNGPPTALTLVSGNTQTGPAGERLPNDLVVFLQDATGRAVPAAQVSWTVSGGTLSATIDSTGEDGRSSVQWTLPLAPGDYSVEASVNGLVPVRFVAKATPANGPLVFRYLDAGSYHACGITTAEEIYCWGYNGDGQAGNGAGGYIVYPTLLERGDRFRAVSGGRYHTCGLTLSGEVTCWGAGRDGRTSGGGGATYQYVQAGEVHTCGVTITKEVWCWGWNEEGELGRGYSGGTGGAASISVPIDSPLGPGWTDSLPPVYQSVAVGGLHSCAIMRDDEAPGGGSWGDAYCWGYGREGQLGVGPIPFPFLPPFTDRLFNPTRVAPGTKFRAEPFTVVPRPPDPNFPIAPGPFIAAGFAHTCGLTTTGSLLCWGLNEHGQLGNGTQVNSNIPVAAGGPTNFVQVTAGNSHTCAITAAGAAYCWGNNTFGQLGDGTTFDQLSPVPVAGGLVFAYIKAGELSTCGLTTAGVGYCWGNNEYGQLGDGTRTSASAPRKVAFQP